MCQSNDESGAVTAEFAVVLPAVFMILAISIGSLSAQLERLKLVSIAGMISRAVAREESAGQIRDVFAEQLKGRSWQLSSQGMMACVEVSRPFGLAGLPEFSLRLAEMQCARKLGL